MDMPQLPSSSDGGMAHVVFMVLLRFRADLSNILYALINMLAYMMKRIDPLMI